MHPAPRPVRPQECVARDGGSTHAPRVKTKRKAQVIHM
ncbi:hypothetical protein BURMUCF2_A0976 [Burkholderia multivorans CF2]|nr:hypothetical protein BURMUCF2_A0976 [Burkholderia multivorans CF2]